LFFETLHQLFDEGFFYTRKSVEIAGTCTGGTNPTGFKTCEVFLAGNERVLKKYFLFTKKMP
jgi:hypothetical protein